MSEFSSINTLIGTFSSIDDINRRTTDTSNLICIDTSNNRIGINTIDPSYSITIINTTNNGTNNGTNSRNAIATPKLYITEISGITGTAPINMADPQFNRYEVYCDQNGFLRMKQ